MSVTAQLRAVDQSPDLEEARRVLAHESKALEVLGQHLGETFIHTIDILQNIKGKIVVTGMGKSGHVARKIAATLASTGSPAIFVHPAEASHGDLGMVEQSDAVIALSNSGETIELGSILRYTRRFNIPLIGITSKAESTLAATSDQAIILPGVGEACPIGLAPMTSTTMMMALGDAVAAALLCRKGFSTKDFSVLHPGGSLGAKLQKVSDLMHAQENLPLVSEQTSMSEVLVTMTKRSFGCVGVTNQDGLIVGIITDGDLRRHMGSDLLTKTASEVMTPSPLSIKPDALIAEAVQIMNNKKITSLFVSASPNVGAFKPLGIIHIHDCLRAG